MKYPEYIQYSIDLIKKAERLALRFGRKFGIVTNR